MIEMKAVTKKDYVVCAHFDPDNPLDRIDIDTINNIRELYRMNKRQLVSALLGLYRNCLDRGDEYPLSNSKALSAYHASQTDTQESNQSSTNKEIVKTKLQASDAQKKLEEDDFDIQTMENYGSGLFGPSIPE